MLIRNGRVQVIRQLCGVRVLTAWKAPQVKVFRFIMWVREAAPSIRAASSAGKVSSCSVPRHSAICDLFYSVRKKREGVLCRP